MAVTVQPADRGDTTSIGETLCEVMENLEAVSNATHCYEMEETVEDKGYHSNAVMCDLAALKVRSYVSEPIRGRGRRHWKGKAAQRDAVYANRRRIRGERGKRLLRKRGELLERPFAHCYDTGGMRRTHLRGHENILKRLLIHVGACNLGLLMRTLIGSGTPRGLHARMRRDDAPVPAMIGCLAVSIRRRATQLRRRFATARHIPNPPPLALVA